VVRRFLVSVVSVLLLASCGHRATTESAAIPAATLDYNTSQRFKYFYLEAVNQQNKGNFAAAFDLLNHCREINPDAAEVYFMRAAYYATMNKDSLLLADTERAAALNPRNNTYLERLAAVYYGMNRQADAIDAYEKLYANAHDRDDVLNILTQLYSKQKDYDKVLHTINRLEQLEGSSEDITLARMRIYALKGDKKAELAELKALSQKHPNDMNYHVMMGNWLLQNGRTDEARSEYDHVLSIEPDNLQARMSMLDYYSTTGNDSLAAALREQLLISEKTPAAGKVSIVRSVVADSEESGGDTTEVLNLFRRILARPQKTTDMFEVYAAYMKLKGMPKDSINRALESALSIEPDNSGIRLQLVQSAWEDNNLDEIIRLCKPAVEYNPDEMVFYYFLGLAYFQKDEKDEALHTFKLGVSQINESSNKDIVSDFYAIMGDILHEKGQAEEAFAAYDSCLQWKPDNMGCLNNYAYYLSEEGRDLQKAEQMSYRTIKNTPDNSTCLDTYAWILFQQERYSEAEIYIEQAVSNDTTGNEVILEHAGDIQAMLGNTEKALEYWQKAKDAGADAAVINRKIKLKKYVKP